MLGGFFFALVVRGGYSQAESRLAATAAPGRPNLPTSQMRPSRQGKVALFLPPLSRYPVSGTGIMRVLPQRARARSSRQTAHVSGLMPKSRAAGTKPTASRFWLRAKLVAGQYRRCAGFAAVDQLQRQRQDLPGFQSEQAPPVCDPRGHNESLPLCRRPAWPPIVCRCCTSCGVRPASWPALCRRISSAQIHGCP